jgi:TRAP-type mannitol/chloroaromatic compound transport system permease small subunit
MPCAPLPLVAFPSFPLSRTHSLAFNQPISIDMYAPQTNIQRCWLDITAGSQVTSEITMPCAPLTLVAFPPFFWSRTYALAFNKPISIDVYVPQTDIERYWLDITAGSLVTTDFTIPWSPLLLVCFPSFFLDRTYALALNQHISIDMYDYWTPIERCWLDITAGSLVTSEFTMHWHLWNIFLVTSVYWLVAIDKC